MKKITSNGFIFLESVGVHIKLTRFVGDFLFLITFERYFGPGNKQGIASSFNFGYFKFI